MIPENRRINSLESVNKDPMLSELKYHFVCRKVYMGRSDSFSSLLDNAYKYFQSPFLNENSIYIIQIIDSNDKNCFDITFGMRRDDEAIKMAREKIQFVYNSVQYPLELSKAFKIYYQELNSLAKTCPPLKDQHSKPIENNARKRHQANSDSSSSSVRSREARKSKSKDALSFDSSSEEKKKLRRMEASRRLIREEDGEMKKASYKLQIFFLPKEYGRVYVENNICKLKKNAKELFISEWKKEDDLETIILSIKDKSLYEHFRQEGFKIDKAHLLLLFEDEIENKSLKELLKAYQMRAYQYNNQRSFEEFCEMLTNSKILMSENAKVTNICFQEGYYVVTFNKRMGKYAGELSSAEWRFESNGTLLRSRPSIHDKWFKYLEKMLGD